MSQRKSSKPSRGNAEDNSDSIRIKTETNNDSDDPKSPLSLSRRCRRSNLSISEAASDTKNVSKENAIDVSQYSDDTDIETYEEDMEVDVTPSTSQSSFSTESKARKSHKYDGISVSDDAGEGDLGRKRRKGLPKKASVTLNENVDDSLRWEDQKKTKQSSSKMVDFADGYPEEEEESSSNTADTAQAKGTFECYHCQEIFYGTYAIRSHMAVLHERTWSKQNPMGVHTPGVSEKYREYIACSHCPLTMRSILSYYKHAKTCGRDATTIHCGVCNKTMLLSEYDEHIEKGHGDSTEGAADAGSVSGGEEEVVVVTEKKGKRQAAIRAQEKVQNMCSDDYGRVLRPVKCEIKDEQLSVDEGMDNFDGSGSERSVSVYSEDDDEEKYSSAMAGEGGTKKKQQVAEAKKTNHDIARMAEEFFLQHQEENLFLDWRPSMDQLTPLSVADVEPFLPEDQGCEFTIQSHKSEISDPQRLSMFEFCYVNDTYTVNVGGPVWALSWCPLPVNNRQNVDQYLALYTHHSAQESNSLDSCSSTPSIIQFWNFGPLTNRTNNTISPQLCGGLMVDCGAIWEMKWCPTGTWEPDSTISDEPQQIQRLGLLAIATHSGSIHIISIPRFEAIAEGSESKFYRTQSAAILALRGEPSCCLCLDWSIQDQCSLVIAGFSNGMIGIWDLYSVSSLLRQKDQDVGPVLLYPFHTFSAHVWPVTGVAFCQSQPEFFSSCSRDRDIKLWNMKELTHSQITLNKFIKTVNYCIVWPFTSPNTLHSAGDDCYLSGRNAASMYTITNRKILNRPLTCHNASVWGMSFNNWNNTLASCDSTGCIVLGKQPENFGAKTTNLNREVLLTVELINQDPSVTDIINATLSQTSNFPQGATDKKSTPHSKSRGRKKPDGVEEVEKNVGALIASLVSDGADQGEGEATPPPPPEDLPPACACCCHNLGQTTQLSQACGDCCMEQQQRRVHLLFKDYSNVWAFKKTSLINKDMPFDNIINSLPCALYRVAWNPNKQCHNWLAVGGQSGLLRVILVGGRTKSVQRSKK